MSQYLLLKWGTLKGCDLNGNDAAMQALERYYAEPVSMSVMLHQDTEDQKKALCDIIDAMDGPITNDWSGERMSKDEAKKYVLEYRQ